MKTIDKKLVEGTLFEIKYSMYFACWVGAIVLYFKLKTEGKSVTEFSSHIIGDKSSLPFYKILDAVLFSICGAFIGTILTEPNTPQQAVAAGLGWTGLLSAFSKSDND